MPVKEEEEVFFVMQVALSIVWLPILEVLLPVNIQLKIAPLRGISYDSSREGNESMV